MQKNACLSCRQKKLKCDKKQPCANCVTRSVNCELQQLPAVNRGVKRLFDESGSSTLENILARLDRIESYIDQTKDQSSDRLKSTRLGKGLDNSRTPELESQLPDSRPEPVRGDIVTPQVRVSANDNFLRHALMHDLSISISANLYEQQPISLPQVCLPPKWETLRRYEIYRDHDGQFHRIIYEPHFRDLVESVYCQIVHSSTTTAPRGLALILSVIALATLLEPLQGSQDTMPSLLRKRLETFAVYLRASMDCLEQHRRRMDHTLESVQAMLILQYIINQIEIFSPRYRGLIADAVAASHSLGFHRIDSTFPRRVDSHDVADPITQEIKRRVWWYLTATDWMVSMVEGSLQAVYLVNPKLSCTNLPLNIDDNDLGAPNVTAKPLSEPTAMVYVLHRIKVADTARFISDTMPNDPSIATNEMIHSLDSKLESLLQELPAFFQSKPIITTEVQLIDQKHPYIPMQRFMLNIGIDIIRCKLHYPYLTATSDPPLHVFSRAAALKAARNLLEAYRKMLGAQMSHVADFLKIQGTAFFIFMAALIIATDLCCNKINDEERKNHVKELGSVLERLESVKQHSQIAEKFLERLTGLLGRYGVSEPLEIVNANEEERGSADVDPSRDGAVSVLDYDTLQFQELWEAFVEHPLTANTFGSV
ncbi:hypothetical protein EJ04DRAFT_464849 [Polyplosphaeria fusca]|uniref:Zn(2)-C6 fungal-type domain-containing protein n=1 Tax=Polyplosphaeria fusca TaxID=682080 RepID=A0A9P4V0J4_9PLEO|nr:hypothetical protein EJ04DRAFT_464849 [Polyplosphaeria fusca]